MCAPNFESRYRLERATRLCAISPMIATRSPSSVCTPVENGARIQQRLGGVLVRAVARIDDRRGQIAAPENAARRKLHGA